MEKALWGYFPQTADHVAEFEDCTDRWLQELNAGVPFKEIIDSDNYGCIHTKDSETFLYFEVFDNDFETALKELKTLIADPNIPDNDKIIITECVNFIETVFLKVEESQYDYE